MELLGNLEKKLAHLVVLIKELRSEKEQLLKDTTALREHVDQLEQALLKKDEDFKRWDSEKTSARKAVDELIADIDLLIESGSS